MMPIASVYAIRVALVSFVLAAGIGAAMMLARIGWVDGRIWVLRAAHIELWTVSGCSLFALGVAWHMFPRRGGVRGTAQDERVLVGAIGLIVAGVVLRSLPLPGGHLVGGRLAELAGIGLFVWRLAPRIRPFGDAGA